jgi:hypothetical protein
LLLGVPRLLAIVIVVSGHIRRQFCLRFESSVGETRCEALSLAASFGSPFPLLQRRMDGWNHPALQRPRLASSNVHRHVPFRLLEKRFHAVDRQYRDRSSDGYQRISHRLAQGVDGNGNNKCDDKGCQGGSDPSADAGQFDASLPLLLSPPFFKLSLSKGFRRTEKKADLTDSRADGRSPMVLIPCLPRHMS